MKDELFCGASLGTLKLINKPTKGEPALLLLDNYVSHFSLAAINFCTGNKINLLTLPPHVSYKIKSLDKVFFAPLKTVFSSECDKWMTTNCGKTITQKQMAILFNQAYSGVATITKCEKSFEAIGLYSYNPDIFSNKDFIPVEVTNILFEQAHTELRNTEMQLIKTYVAVFFS